MYNRWNLPEKELAALMALTERYPYDRVQVSQHSASSWSGKVFRTGELIADVNLK